MSDTQKLTEKEAEAIDRRHTGPVDNGGDVGVGDLGDCPCPPGQEAGRPTPTVRKLYTAGVVLTLLSVAVLSAAVVMVMVDWVYACSGL